MWLWLSAWPRLKDNGPPLALARALSLGMDPLTAVGTLVDIARTSPGLRWSTFELEGLKQALEGGRELPEVLRGWGFPPIVVHMARVGRAAGDLRGAATTFLSQITRATTRTIQYRVAFAEQLLMLTLVTVALWSAPSFATPLMVSVSSDEGVSPPAAAFAFYESLLPLQVLSLMAVLLCLAFVAFPPMRSRWSIRLVGAPAWNPGPSPLLARYPLTGSLFGRELASGIARSLALLLDVGCSLPQALRLSAMPGFEKDLQAIALRVEDGEELAEALRSSPWLSRWLRRPVVLGAASGDMSGALSEAADQLHEDASRLHEKTLASVKTALHLATALLVTTFVILGYRFIGSIPMSVLEVGR